MSRNVPTVYLALFACALALIGYVAATAGVVPALVSAVLIVLAGVVVSGLHVFVVMAGRILEQLIERR